MNWFTINTETLSSRTFWTGVTAIVTALTTLTGAERIMGVLSGLAALFVRDAISQSNAAATQNAATPVDPSSAATGGAKADAQ